MEEEASQPWVAALGTVSPVDDLVMMMTMMMVMVMMMMIMTMIMVMVMLVIMPAHNFHSSVPPIACLGNLRKIY